MAGIGVAVGAAAVAVPAGAAGAATTVSGGTTYNSTATATAGYVSVGGNQVPVPDNSVTATDTSGPQSASLGLDALTSALPASPLGASAHTAVPSGANLVTESATAQSDGMSSACAGLLAGDCGAGGPRPITISLGLADLPGLTMLSGPSASSSSSGSSSSGSSGSSSGLGSVVKGLVPPGLLPSGKPGGSTSSSSSSSSSSSRSSGSSGSGSNPLAGYQIVLTLSGPEAACTAGPPGSSGANFTASASLASASLDIVADGRSVLPNGPVKLSTGDILSQIPALPPQLTQVLGNTLSASPLDLTVNPGSTSGAGAGPVTTATAGELGLSVSGTQLLSVVGAKATCGPDHAAAGTTSTTSSEVPLGGGIQTDEGRSGSGDSALWLGVAGGAALAAGGAGGFTAWRRRRS